MKNVENREYLTVPINIRYLIQPAIMIVSYNKTSKSCLSNGRPHLLGMLAPWMVFVQRGALNFSLFAAFLAGTASAQQTINYTDGEIDSNAITITGPTNPTTLTIATGTATQSGVVSDSGASGSLIMSGMGTIVLTAANTYSGNTTIDFGSLEVQGAAGSISSPNATVYVGYYTGDNGALLVANGGQISDSGAYIGYGFFSAGQGGPDEAVVTGVNANGTPSTWSNAFGLEVGNNSVGALNIQDGGYVSDLDGYIGAGSSGMVTVTGVNANGTASTWNNGIYLVVGGNVGAGTLNIQNGGQVSSSSSYIGGTYGGGAGVVTVTGVNANGTASTLSNSTSMTVGGGSQGTLNIENGGKVTDVSGFVGDGTYGSGTATVTGINASGLASTWSNSGDLNVGSDGVGTLTIQDGGQVTDVNGSIGDYDSNGAVTVTGKNANGTVSAWSNSSSLYVSDVGTGALTIENAGMVSSPAVTMKSSGISSGTLNLDSNGVLETGAITNVPFLEFGSEGFEYVSNVTINFNGGILRATANSADFISNFTVGEVNLASGGGTIDNNCYSITVNAPLGGVGALASTGTGTLTLTGSNTYSGGTTVTAGTLLANSSNSTGLGAVTVSSGGALGGSGTINPSGVTSGVAVNVAAGAALNQSAASGGVGTSTLIVDLNTDEATTVNLAQGSKYDFDLGASGVSDQVIVKDGEVTLNDQNFSDFTFTTLSGFTGVGTYDLVVTDTSGDLLGSLGEATGIIDGDNATLSVINSQDLVLTIAAVPEPSTWAMLLGGLGLLAFWRWRARRLLV